MLMRWNHLEVSLDGDTRSGSGLRLELIGQRFQALQSCYAKIAQKVLRLVLSSFLEIFLLVGDEHFVHEESYGFSKILAAYAF